VPECPVKFAELNIREQTRCNISRLPPMHPETIDEMKGMCAIPDVDIPLKYVQADLVDSHVPQTK
jgi:hypothetical protein